VTWMSDYYSRRNKPFTKNVDFRFWNAFKAYIDEIAANDWLYEQFGDEDNDFGRTYHYIVGEKVKRRMLQETGVDLYPLPQQMPGKDFVLDLIEFFFKFVSIQVEDKFDGGAARYQYTVGINQLFNNFKLSYKLEKGIVKERHSGFMDRALTRDDFAITDLETQNLVNMAVEKFSSRKIDEQRIGLEKLVDAFQRVSSWENSNKVKSVGAILDRLSKEQSTLKEPLETELQILWKIANDFMIRHTEMDKIKIIDSDFMEYLFYRYYGMLRFVFKKYGFDQKGQSSA
jgi:hypothetical protein